MNYSKDTISKIGNAVVYLAEKIPDLSRTKLLKLLYLAEEQSVIKNKVPFFGIEFQVWRFGPVAKEIYVDLSEKPALLNDFIDTKIVGDNNVYITAKKKFNDDEFSDDDIDVLDTIIEKYGSKTAAQLVDITHKKGTAWYDLAQKNNLQYFFDNQLQNSSDVEIDFNYYLTGCASEFYNENLEIHKHFEALKNNV